MADRQDAQSDFLAQHGWADSARTSIAGDASARTYLRLCNGDQRAILMDADPATGEDVRPFVRIAAVLHDAGLSAPRIYAQDAMAGFLLLEDLGDRLFARLLLERPGDANTLYTAATDVLAHLYVNAPPSGLIRYDAAHMAELTEPAPVLYRAGVTGQRDAQLETEFTHVLRKALAPAETGPFVLALRDYHAENLIWLPDRTGVARVGLLDFQDAVLAHPAYDLTSVLQDARRDVPAEVEQAMLDHYVFATGANPTAFRQAYAALALQRNLRILGIFARLSLRDGKPGYLKYVPRVWTHVQTSLARLGDAELTKFIHETLPAPDDAVLAQLGGTR